jgi:outer membrane receptor protein involved in Fe transport
MDKFIQNAFKTGVLLLCSFSLAQSSWALTEGTLSGTVYDPQSVAVSNASVKILSIDGRSVKETVSSLTGEYQIFPLTFGDYQLVVEAPGFAAYQIQVHVQSGGTTQEDVHLSTKGAQEMVLEVKAKRHLVQNSSSQSTITVTKEQIAALPQGNQISLPRLLETTSPGVVQGPFNQIFIRGNHANIQYQIDGIQLPDSASGTFAEAFSPRNIDHYELITGGIPSEFGERLAAVMNIVTKTGPESPGGSVEMNYGSYNTISPQAIFGGSSGSGDVHYFLSANYHQTDRGLDTPQPATTADDTKGGTDAIHDHNNGNNQFGKLDWLLGNDDKISLILFQSYNKYEIPNFPSSFNPHDPYFDSSSSYSDQWGNAGFGYRLADTNDIQYNRDAYAQLVWKHTFSEKSFLQVAPYWKYSGVRVDDDPANDLAPGNPSNATYYNTGNSATAFVLNQHVNNEGVKADYSVRPNNSNLVKAGFQLQASQSHDNYSISSFPNNIDATLSTPTTFSGGSDDKGYEEAAYVQDDYQISKAWSLNVGLRMTGVQFNFGDETSNSDQLQPRVGLNYLATETTKLHAFYGRLFQPAPLENLRTAFDQAAGGSTTANFYDIKPEKDNYFEVGVDQQIGETHVTSVNVYYKAATDMLDDTQLLNTSIASPYNYANGYAYGVEYSLHGKIDSNWSDYFNYSYEIAKGKNISGGTFAVDPASIPQNTYLFLDHVQIHTANSGVTYAKDQYYGTVQGLFGSGLRTGDQNQFSLPSHFTFDLSAGYNFTGESFWSKWKLSGDVLNVTNNVYPITIANGFNGSHYAADREFFVRLTKEL